MYLEHLQAEGMYTVVLLRFSYMYISYIWKKGLKLYVRPLRSYHLRMLDFIEAALLII